MRFAQREFEKVGKYYMNDRQINIINRILYYMIAPLLVLEFILSDLKIITFTKLLYGISIAVFLVFCAISLVYKRQHPDYEFKANVMYTRILFAVVLLECFYASGFFSW